MLNEALEFVERHVSVDGDPMEEGFADAQNAFGDVEEVRLFEIRVCRVINEGYRVGKLMLEQAADFLVGTFGHGGDILEDFRVFGVEIHVEML